MLVAEVGCLWVGSVQVDGHSMEATGTLVGSGLSHSYVSLLTSDGLTDWRTLWYELGTLGFLGDYSL